MLDAVAGEHLRVPVIHARRDRHYEGALGHFGADPLALTNIEEVGNAVVLLAGHDIRGGLQ
jgi:hypothetical protein